MESLRFAEPTGERSVNYVCDFPSFLAISKYRAPLSDARSKGLRNEVINAPRFSRGCASSPVFRGVLRGVMQITLDISDGRVLLEIKRRSDGRRYDIIHYTFLAYKIRRLILHPLHPLALKILNFLIIDLSEFGILRFCIMHIQCVIARNFKFLLFPIIKQKF